MNDPAAHSGLDFHFGGFHALMPHRIDNVLLVCSLYESYILEEDGLVNELILTEFQDMNLTQAPRVKRTSTGKDALAYLEKNPVDLVISMTRLGQLNVLDFAQAAKQLRRGLPVVALVDNPHELVRQPSLRDRGRIDGVFVWNGDPKILLAIVKLIEDRLNAEHDTHVGDVRVIILVENSVRFYSTYLPLIYSELMKLTQSLMREGINPLQRMLRMRARPKIVLAETYEEAADLYGEFSENLLGVISDVRFPRGGELDPQAGIYFTRLVKDASPHMPVLVQSSDEHWAPAARELGAYFLNKRSRRLLQELRAFIVGSLGFGEFVFRTPDGREVGRAGDLRTFEQMVAVIPTSSLDFHGRQNHFSNWLMARTEFEMAARIRPRKAEEFRDTEEIRTYLLATLAEFRERSQGGVVADFSPKTFGVTTSFVRIGGGSLGGKARGLAFVNALLRRHQVLNRFPGVRIAVPSSAAIGTDVFDAFLEKNELHAFVAEDREDAEIERAFMAAKLPMAVQSDLAAFLRVVRYPLAVRSSSMLEDSHERPFAGIYSTYMLPNNHPDLDVRLEQLVDAVKLVYASTFFRAARRYLEATGYHAEEERMGVILQQLVGAAHGDRFYPTFSGVARSYNFYPAADMKPEEGVVCAALGLGKQVVDGGKCLMFSPAHPHVLPQFATVQDMLENSQRDFYALDVSRADLLPTRDESASLAQFGLNVAEEDGALHAVGSVFSPENDMVYEGLNRPGVRLVSFAPVLDSELFPLAEVLTLMLEIGRDGMGCPIEIEFAVDMTARPMEFGFLQIRPIVSDEEFEAVRLDEVDPSDVVCFSRHSLGNGRIGGVRDVIYVRPEHFDAALTRDMAEQIGRINDGLRRGGRSCVLIGPGRWGTSDPWLGIPVAWEQISSARLIVETSLHNFMVTPSQGTHFFQNLTSLGVGYLTVDAALDDGRIDWAWLDAQPAEHETELVRHVSLPQPLPIRLDGRTRCGAVLKPGDRDGEDEA